MHISRSMLALAFLCVLSLAIPLSARQVVFYIGTYTGPSGSKGIYESTLDVESGQLSAVKLAAEVPNPSFLALAPNGRVLYAALEDWKDGAVATFERESDGPLKLLGKQPAGAGTCFISCDGSELLAANYNSGSIAGFHLTGDGGLKGPPTTLTFSGTGPNKDRQTSPHAHSVYSTPDGQGVYACDLGTDHIWISKFNPRGELVLDKPSFASVPPGNGPRHLAFSKDGRFVFVSNEMGNSVTVLSRDALTNELKPLQEVSVFPSVKPSGKVTTAEVVLHPSGKWLYVSNRGCDTISVFSVASNGELSLIESIPALVKGPRSFGIDPTGRWLVVAGQDDNRLAEFSVDSATGKLKATSQSATVGSPVCVLFTQDWVGLVAH